MSVAWFARMIFEQFTVAGAVYVDPFTYKCMDGELIEKEIRINTISTTIEFGFSRPSSLSLKRIIMALI